MRLGARAAALLALAWALAAQAQTYPSKPIRLLIAASPGGGTDGIGRVMAEALSAGFKQPVVAENRGGASGMIASDLLVKSAPDGYTIMITQNAHVTNPALFKKLPYDTFKDFTPIAPLARSPLVLIAATGTGVKTVKELLDLSKRDPRAMNFAAAESSTRLAIEQLAEATGIAITSLPYKGTGPAVADVAGGHVNFSVTTIASVLPFRGTGKLNIVAVMAGERTSFLPDVPTLAEQGLARVDVRGWWGIFAPPNMPPALVEQLNGAIRTVLSTPPVRQKIHNFSAEVWLGSPQELEAFIRSEVPAIQALAKKAGIEPE
ncbi:MAG TPA: tripartite tricarboxylate transporter substrate-binding protein [Burkholderiales bacterium]|nr:tripartite tricarboxylate transporter substrate-binding protein [Burkholderiales bacterium]